MPLPRIFATSDRSGGLRTMAVAVGVLTLAATNAFAQCEVASAEVVRTARWGGFDPSRWVYAIEARDVGGELLWEFDFGSNRVCDVLVLPDTGNAERILVLGGRSDFHLLDCDGSPVRSVVAPDGLRSYSAGYFTGDGESIALFHGLWTGAHEIRAFAAPVERFEELVSDPSAFATWARRLDGEAGPYDDRRFYDLRAAPDTLRLRTYTTDRYGELYPWNVWEYVFGADEGQVLSPPFVDDFEVVDARTVVARDLGGAELWRRTFDAPAVEVRTPPTLHGWRATVLFDGDGMQPPTFVTLGALGTETSRAPLGDASPAARIVENIVDLRIVECDGIQPVPRCTTYDALLVVVDPTTDYVRLHPRQAIGGLYGSWSIGPLRYQGLEFLGDMPVVVGERPGVGPVVWYRSASPDFPGPRERIVANDRGIGADETVVAWHPIDPLRAECVFSSGRSVVIEVKNAQDLVYENPCPSYDVDGDADVDGDDVLRLSDHLLRTVELTADEVCRADIDEHELADVVDLVRVYDRVESGGIAPTVWSQPDAFPVDLDVTVVDAIEEDGLQRLVLEIDASDSLRATRFSVELQPGAVVRAIRLDSVPSALARTTDTEACLVWDEAVDRFPVTIDFEVVDPSAFDHRLVLRRFAVATDGFEVEYPSPLTLHLDQIDFGAGTIDTDPDEPPAIRRPDLAPPVPNPFNPGSRLVFGLDRDRDVDLRVLDARGRHVRTLVAGPVGGGEHAVLWDGRDDQGLRAASGVYFVRFQADEIVVTRKVALVE